LVVDGGWCLVAARREPRPPFCYLGIAPYATVPLTMGWAQYWQVGNADELLCGIRLPRRSLRSLLAKTVVRLIGPGSEGEGSVDRGEDPKAGIVPSAPVPRFAGDSPWFWADVW